jgi:hypothetical protein
MPSDLITFGPYDVGFDTHKSNSTIKHISAQHGKDFWAGEAGELAQKQGCYVFSVRYAGGVTPWYVGKATKCFKQECFTHHKLGHYNKVLFERTKGTPVMYFVALPGTLRKVPEGDIKDIEKFLTQSALFKNPNLSNIQNTKNLPKWSIKGVIRSGPGKPTNDAIAFRKMLGLKMPL